MATGISHRVIAAAAVAALVIGVSSASAAGSTSTSTSTTGSHRINWQTASRTVFCGIAPRVPGTQLDPGTGAMLNADWPGLQCGAEGIGARHHDVGDPFVQLGQGTAGRARLVYLSEDDLASSAAPVTLRAGSNWSRDGITCSVAAASVTCHNSSGHGFILSKGHLTTH
jgi:hypothetical protein